MTIECKYSCADCGLSRIPVSVEIRTAEDVVVWLESICIPALVADHEKRSPCCHPSSFSEVMVPVPEGTKKIGGAVEN